VNPGAAMPRRGAAASPAGRLLPVAAGAALVALWAALWAVAVDAHWSRLLLDCVFGWSLLSLAWIDWRQLRLPDALTLPLLGAGLAAAALDGQDALLSGVIGALAGYAALRLVGEGYLGLRGREGLGQGDAKLLAAGGAWLGWEALPWVVLLAALLGLACAIVQRARGAALTRETALPFGPPLALAIWVVRLHGFPEL
jgi:leader peptidase (prepilin peptidase) / N-methyltransferase